MAALRRLALAWVLAALGAAAWAQDLVPVPPLSGRVIDQTGTLSAAQAAALTDKLARLEAAHGSQVVVLLLPTTQPEDIADYTQRLGDAWKIGRSTVGDGLIIVVAKDDRRMRIAPAKALEGAVPDLAARRIIDEQMKPAFQQGDYAGGLNLAVDQLSARIAGENLAPPDRASPAARPGFNLEDAGILLLVGVPLVGGIATSVFGRRLGSVATAGAVGGLGWWLTASLVIAAGAGVVALLLVAAMGGGRRGSRRLGGVPVIWGGGFGGGGGGFGGGGFGSGGGGDFGGGGASGDW